jgi:alcohol dehydrogenase class IV
VSAGRVEFGPGAIAVLPEAVGSLGRRRALVVTDPGLRAAGLLDRVVGLLQQGGVTTEVVDDIRANPRTEDLDAVADRVRAFAAPAHGSSAVVVALGGGSALDAAKAVALMAVNPGRAADFDHRRPPAVAGLPIAAIPTTAGTGAETNGFGVVEDTAPDGTCCKVYLGHDSVRPRVVVLDPELTLGLPPAITAATGIDALVHGLESLASRGATPASAGYARQVVAMVHRWLPIAVADGGDLEARGQMLTAAHLAGRALSLSGLGLVHGIGHSLTNHLGTVHGVALAAVLPEVMSFCADGGAPGTRGAYAIAAEAMGSSDAIAAAGDLAASVGVRRPLSQLGLTAQAVPDVARGAVADVVSLSSPRTASPAEVEELLASAL